MDLEDNLVYLVDGSSYIHRAYHAIRHLSNSKGFPTNAIFGFTKMILKLINDKVPPYLAIAFDAKGPTFRHEIYADYKANRPPMPEDLVVQLPHIHQIVNAFNILMLEIPGYEADDIIGTLTRISEEQGHPVVIVTGDKDFNQLISERVTLWDTMRERETNKKTFEEKYQFGPDRFIDLLGLSGDSADNIPGVPGIGAKTAAKLIRQFGSLENVFEHLEEIKGNKLKENLKSAQGNALLSKRLARIDCFTPIDKGVDDMKVGPPDLSALAEIFNTLEFRSLWEQFAPKAKPISKTYSLCLSDGALNSLIDDIRKSGYVSLDTETTSPDPMQAELVGISFSIRKYEAFYLPLGHRYLGAPKQVDSARALKALKGVLEDPGIGKIGQNIKYDALVLKRAGIELQGLHFDTMIASYVINPGLRQHNLDTLAQHYLNHRMITYKELAGTGKNQRLFSEIDVESARDYSCEDADITLQLKEILGEDLESNGNESLFQDIEMRLLPVLMDMEWNGIKIDTAFFRTMSAQFAEQIKAIEKEIYLEAGMEFNINSPQQLGYVLFEKLGLPVQKKTTKKKAYSTDMTVLKKLSTLPFKIPKLLLRYRTLSKLKSTYLDALIKMVNPDTGRIHTSYNQTVAATGRLSSSDPNLQNIPVRGEEGKAIRQGFIAEEGHLLLSADYSQIELRVFAHYSEDDAYVEAFRQDEDIHTRTASELLHSGPGKITPDMRRIAKAINFGIIYGMGPQKLSEELGIDLNRAKDYISTYYERYQGVKRYREDMIAFAKEKGYVTTLFNRRRYLPDIHHRNRMIQGEAERMAVNTPIQGTAADLIKKAMIHIHGRLGRENFKSRMLLQVHDELVFEVPEGEVDRMSEMVREGMEGVYELNVPLKVDIHVGGNWGEAH